MNYYDKNKQEFINSTLDIDMSSLYSSFVCELKKGARVLDIGCGPGRDLKYFTALGHEVIGLEPSRELAKFARSHSGCEVLEETMQTAKLSGKFDGVWACASLLHIPRRELSDVFTKIANIMNDGGIFYCSFKLGEFEGERNGRFFNDQTLETIREYLPKSLSIKESWVTQDKRPERDEKWLNLLLNR